MMSWETDTPYPFFGEPWPSRVCDIGNRVPVPVGQPCVYCDETITPDDAGSFVMQVRPDSAASKPVHRECSLRSVIGGIGHLEDHDRWCLREHDPDGGRTARQSALDVWTLVQEFGIDALTEKS